MKTCESCPADITNLHYRAKYCAECARKRQAETNARCRERNKAEVLQRTRDWREKNREHIKQYNSGYKKENAEAVKEGKKAYIESHPEERVKAAERSRAYKKANPHKPCEQKRRRKARKLNAQIGEVDYAKALERDGLYCYLCESDILNPNEIHYDHVVPLSRGGSHSMDNIKVTHGLCNMRKGVKFLEELSLPMVNPEMEGELTNEPLPTRSMFRRTLQ